MEELEITERKILSFPLNTRNSRENVTTTTTFANRKNYRFNQKKRNYFLLAPLKHQPDRLARRIFSYLEKLKMADTRIKESDKNIEVQSRQDDVRNSPLWNTLLKF